MRAQVLKTPQWKDEGGSIWHMECNPKDDREHLSSDKDDAHRVTSLLQRAVVTVGQVWGQTNGIGATHNLC